MCWTVLDRAYPALVAKGDYHVSPLDFCSSCLNSIRSFKVLVLTESLKTMTGLDITTTTPWGGFGCHLFLNAVRVFSPGGLRGRSFCAEDRTGPTLKNGIVD